MHALPTVECLEVPKALEGAKSAGVMTEVSMGQRTAAQGVSPTAAWGATTPPGFRRELFWRELL